MLTNAVAFDPDVPLEAFLERVPAAWCVYLLADAAGRPVQLLCVKSLKASLRRRLGDEVVAEDSGPSRRIDYRALVRQVRWTRVDSAFEQDALYLEAARTFFPESYAGVLGFKPAWWLHLDPAADRPRPTRTTEPGQQPGHHFGPLPEKHAAQKLVQTVEDLFDLCRDAAALANAPAAPCQWRQMGKCVGPCDGSIDLDAYRALVHHAASVLSDVPRTIENQRVRMSNAAAALQYETAGRIKQYVEKLETLRDGPNRHVRPIGQFRFLAVMPGRRRDSAKLFVITPGRVGALACLTQPPTQRRGEEVLRASLAAMNEPAGSLDKAACERMSLVAHHLFPSRKTPGVFIPLADLDDRALAAAFREVNRAPQESPAREDEGEVRGLQAI